MPSIQRATPGPSGLVWCATDVRPAPPDQYRGLHHIYIDAFDATGAEMRGAPGVQAAWDWEGRSGDERADPAPLNKPAGEHMANIPLIRNQKASVWIVSPEGHASDVVTGLHTGASGHETWLVTFRLVAAETLPTLPPLPPLPSGPYIDAAVAALNVAREGIERALVILNGMLQAKG